MFSYNSVTKRLLSYRRKSNCETNQAAEANYSEKVVKSLVKKLKTQEINQLEDALSSRNQFSKCVCIPR